MDEPAARPPQKARPPLASAAVAAFLLSMIVRPSDAPATVAEQRARLPPAAECDHPVEGTWKANVFTPNDRSWVEFFLEVHAVPGSATELRGSIKVDTWRGGREQSEPGRCPLERYKGSMDGRGSIVDGHVSFAGGPFRLDEMVCGDPLSVRYAPDHFSGRLEPERQEFQAVNNDGRSAVNEPTVFRRIGCLDDGPVPASADVKPPPFFPDRRDGGC